MTTPTDITSALAAINATMIADAAKLTSAEQATLIAATSAPSPVDKIVGFADAVASFAAAPTDMKSTAASMVAFAAQFGWHGMDARGPDMIAALTNPAK